MDTKTQLKEIYRPIMEPLETVRATVNRLWRDALHLVCMPQVDMPGAGGKLLRPALSLLSAGVLGERNLDRFARMAAAYEVLHMASLAHDDVVDHSFLRRGSNSLNALWDNHAAVLGGDYLVARAVEMLCEYGVCDVVAGAVRTVREMAECELAFFGKERDTVREEDCARLAAGKTASLFSAACEAPALVLGSPESEPLREYGRDFGVAFQMVDDILDLTRDPDELGKPACGDITEGKATIPLLYLRESLPEEEQKRLDALAGAPLGAEDITWVRERLENTGSLERAHAVTQGYVERGKLRIMRFPESECRRSMIALLDFVYQRNS
ncbi:MAG: polyprenyl synthetase family protein [Candidatus Hydrogenedens sp.]|nr:polyprenyl synthetase family protein [Candidatus Hydrogenedentota bacterium]NLF58741.1 polyprenyl synthetase family protein [Candidatus Hydrogenedens sp.]